jgi:hypothetical protein
VPRSLFAVEEYFRKMANPICNIQAITESIFKLRLFWGTYLLPKSGCVCASVLEPFRIVGKVHHDLAVPRLVASMLSTQHKANLAESCCKVSKSSEHC